MKNPQQLKVILEQLHKSVLKEAGPNLGRMHQGNEYGDEGRPVGGKQDLMAGQEDLVRKGFEEQISNVIGNWARKMDPNDMVDILNKLASEIEW